MDNTKKTLKSPYKTAFAFCEECKAKVAGEAQKSLAREVLSSINIIETFLDLFGIEELHRLRNLLKQIIG